MHVYMHALTAELPGEGVCVGGAPQVTAAGAFSSGKEPCQDRNNNNIIVIIIIIVSVM
jgi:hypothetical protein